MATNKNNANSWNGVKTDKCISLDLDLTLVHTFAKISSITKVNPYTSKNSHLRKRIYTIDLHDVVDKPGKGSFSRMWGVYRPGWFDFHDFCRGYFKHVIVWSAGQPRYVDAIVDILFPDPTFQPLIIYNWKHCRTNGDNIYKPLSQLSEDPRTKDIISLDKIYHLDDRGDTFSLNKGNGILMPVYEVKASEESIMKDDTHLLQLQNWLSKKEVAEASDVRTLDKNAIFVRKKITIKKKSSA